MGRSHRRGTKEYREKRARGKREREKAEQKANKEHPKDAKAYSTNATWKVTDLELAGPAAKKTNAGAKMCVDCGRKGHLSGRAKKQCTAEGIRLYEERKGKADAEQQKKAKKNKVNSIVCAGQEVVEWCDVWELTRRINTAMKKDPTVHQDPEQDPEAGEEDPDDHNSDNGSDGSDSSSDSDSDSNSDGE